MMQAEQRTSEMIAEAGMTKKLGDELTLGQLLDRFIAHKASLRGEQETSPTTLDMYRRQRIQFATIADVPARKLTHEQCQS